MTVPDALYPVGTKGHYYSAKGGESPRHGQPGKVVSYTDQKMLIEFNDPRLGHDTATKNQFEPI